MYGRELKLNGYESSGSKKSNYAENSYLLPENVSITSQRKNISYSFSRVGTNKFKETISNYYKDTYVEESVISRIK